MANQIIACTFLLGITCLVRSMEYNVELMNMAKERTLRDISDRKFKTFMTGSTIKGGPWPKKKLFSQLQ